MILNVTEAKYIAARDRWLDFARRAFRVVDFADGGFAMIAARYCEEHRRYHTLAHVLACLDALDRYGKDVGPDAGRTIELAIWMHDVVYDPRAERGESENQSALVARGFAALVGFRGHGDYAEDAVRSTARSGAWLPPSEAGTIGRWLHDVDLSILGAESDSYAAYASEIRQEYAFVPDLVFRPARMRVLRSIMDRHPIYWHANVREDLEEKARRNMEAEIESLKVPA